MFCLLPSKIEDFKRALKDRAIDIGDLINMSTEDRTALLGKYAGDNAKDVNTLFEEKLVLKNRMMGIRNWASKMGGIGRYGEEGKAALEKSLSEYRAAQQERIFSPKQHEAFLNDLADRKMGTHISREVAAKVFELSAKAEKLRAEPTDRMSGVSKEYIKARDDLHTFVQRQMPISAWSSIWRNLLGISRDHLLMNPATPIKTTIGQIENHTIDRITRRLAEHTLTTGIRPEIRQAYNEAQDTFHATRNNLEMVEGGHIGEGLGKLGEGIRLNVAKSNMGTTNPLVRGLEAGVRKYATGTNYVAIHLEHNIIFTKFYQRAFFDSAGISAHALAKSEGLSGTAATDRTREVFKDAVRIEPKTKEGAMVRTAAQMQAARVTSVNDTVLAKAALWTKDEFNKFVPGLGNLLMPIAKIPANILWNGIENAGVGLGTGIWDIAKGRKAMQSPDMETRLKGMATFAHGIQTISRTIGVLSAAAFFSSQLQKKDFRTDPISGQHYVLIGGLWINMEYIAAVSPALAGMMYEKEHAVPGQGVGATIGQYAEGAGSGYKNLPGIDLLFNINLASLFTSRAQPAFIPKLESGRPIEGLFFGAHGVETPQEVAQDNVIKARKAAAKRAAAHH